MAHSRHLPPLPWLIAFEAAARHKSFGSAAKVLGTSQPAISQRIANLEAMLAVTLFKRLPRGVDLTPQGAVLLAGLSDGLGQISQAIENARLPSLRDLAVATDFGFAAFWLIPRLASLQHAMPDVNVRVITSQTVSDVRREPGDVAVLFGPSAWPGCGVDLLIRETVVPVCSPAFLDGHPRLGTPAELQAVPLLHLEASPGCRWLDWSGWFHGLGAEFVPGANRVSINNYSLLIQASLEGQGVVLGWRPLVDDLLACGRLVPVLDRAVTTENGYYIVHRQAGANARLVTRFRAWMRAQVDMGSTATPTPSVANPRDAGVTDRTEAVMVARFREDGSKG